MTNKLLFLLLLLPFTFHAKAQQPVTIDIDRIKVLCAELDDNFYAITSKETEDSTLLKLKSKGGFPTYLRNAYYDNGYQIPSIVMQKFERCELLRIGEGTLLIEQVNEPYLSYSLPTDMTETAYYFLNGTLVRVSLRMGYTDYSYTPSDYWISTVSANLYYQSGEFISTDYMWNDQPVPDIDSSLKRRLMKDEAMLVQRANELYTAYKSKPGKSGALSKHTVTGGKSVKK